MDLERIQNFYDAFCRDQRMLRPIAKWLELDGMRGIYVQHPFPRIYLDPDKATPRTVWHELLHHVNPWLEDGDEFEATLDRFIRDNESKYLIVKAE